jgi:hypothetical protein
MRRLVPMLALLAAALRSMLTRVLAEVVATTSDKQVPWSNSSLLGEVAWLQSERASPLPAGVSWKAEWSEVYG